MINVETKTVGIKLTEVQSKIEARAKLGAVLAELYMLAATERTSALRGAA